jgi:Lamin Tail Domain
MTRSLTGYTAPDKANHVYKFGTFSLGGGKSVRIHTGKGTNTSTDRYWARDWYVWNNTGDKAYLRNSSGTLGDSCSWGSGGAGYIYC